MSFHLPLIPVGGRGDIGYTKTLVIENHWQMRNWRYYQGPGGSSWSNPQYKAETSYTGIPGMPQPGEIGILYGRRSRDRTPNYTVGSSGLYTALTQLTFVGLDGTETTLRDALTDGVPKSCDNAASDGTGGFSRGTVFTDRIGNTMTFVSDAPIRDLACGDTSFAVMNGLEILRPSGTLYLHGSGTKITIQGGGVTSVTDRNGNTANGNGASTDILGRSIAYGSIKGFAGQPRNVQIITRSLGEALRSDFTLKTYFQLFSSLNTSNMLQSDGNTAYNPQVVAEVTLPNGTSYKFKYSSYGQLSEVDTPTGGRVEYDWSVPFFETYSGLVKNTGLIEKREYISQTATQWESRTTFSTGDTTDYCPNSVACNTKAYVGRQVRDVDGTIKTLASSTHFYYGVLYDGSSVWKPYPGVFDGREFRTEIYDENGILKSVNDTIWNSNSYTTTLPTTDPAYQQINLPTLPYVQESTNTLIEGTKAARTTFTYDSKLRLTDKYEYDYGNQFARRTHTDYVTDTNYFEKYLRTLPMRTWVSSDINGLNKVSLSELEYDNYTPDANHAALWDRTSGGSVSVLGHDSANYGTGKIYRANVTKVTSYANAQSQTGPVNVYSQYDILGNVVVTIDANGNASTISYNDNFGFPDGEARSNGAPAELGGQNTFAFPTSMTNALGWVTGYSQLDYYTGKPVDTEDINGVVSSIFYNDPLNRPTQAIAANNNLNFRRQATSVYDDTNRTVTTTSDLFSFGDNLLKIESFYDSLGRSVESRKYEGSGYVTTLTAFDGLGRPRRATNPYRPLQNEPQLWTESKYDSLGRVIEGKTPDNAKISTSYYSNTVTVTDQAGKQRRSITNALGQLIRVDEPNDFGQLDVSGVPAQPTSYSYDTLNNLTTVTQGVQTRSFVYDSLSRLNQATNPESGTISYIYDANGNLTQKTDARQVVTNYIYDALNRVTQRNYTAPTGLANYQATPNVTYTYDDASIQFSKGKLTKIASSFSTTEYTSFDILGRVTRSKQTTDGVVYGTDAAPMTYTYNLSGALIEQAYPSGRKVKNALDANGDLAQVQSQKSPTDIYRNYANNFVYTAGGAVSSLRLGNGKFETTQFNSRLQATQIGLGSSASSQNLLKLNYDYGTTANNGNVVSQTITVPTVWSNTGFTAVQTYNYDSLNRLKEATEMIGTIQTWKQTFLYDRYGNRNFDTTANRTTTIPTGCAVAVCNPSVDPANNKLVGYQFDNSGNSKVDANGQVFIYDSENKQVEVRNAAGAVVGQYSYDGDGKRVKKYVPSTGETTIFVYDASGKSIAEYSTLVAPASQAKVSYLTTDPLGSPRITTDATGTAISRRDFMPFGEEISRTNYGADNIRQKFTGYERDTETDLDFAQARYYNKQHGRFTGVDPINITKARMLNPQGFNLYSYVRNNPLRFTDPKGEDVNLANETEEGRRKALLSVTKNLNVAEQKNVGVRKNTDGKYEVYIKDPSKISMNKASDGYKYLTDRVNNHDLKIDFTLIQKGGSAPLEINGVQTRLKQSELAKDAGGVTISDGTGNVSVFVAEGGRVGGVIGLTKSGKETPIAFPEYIVTGHELFGETQQYVKGSEHLQQNIMDNNKVVIDIENDLRRFHGLPMRSYNGHVSLGPAVEVHE